LPVSAAISGLQPGTTYHYRFRALSTTSAQGWVYGSDMTFTTVPSIPENTTVTGSETGTNCYNASNTITVAGGGSTYNLAPGGNATFIAGQKISFLPGTTIQSGAYMLAYITTNNQYCNSMDNPLVSASGSNEKDAEQPTFATEVDNTIKLYPNPVTSSTTLEISGSGFESATRATIFTMSGAPVLSQTLEGCGKYMLSLTNLKAGIYLLRITGEQSTATLRIVKM
jgi:hypothetical protein